MICSFIHGKRGFASIFCAFLITLSIGFFASDVSAQKKSRPLKPLNTLGTFETHNTYIWANVDQTTGRVTVYLPPGRLQDPSLDFPDHSYFTCKINGTYFTNNEIISIPLPPPSTETAIRLTDGNTVKILDPNRSDPKKICDTVRTTWLNKNGVDIIQDIYPVSFTKSGQIVYKWRFKNNNGSPAAVACQYLQDIEITDQSDPSNQKSNDGPIVLTKWDYYPVWKQFPNTSQNQSLPPFYIGFQHDLPNGPSFFPNLSGQGYVDYPLPPLNLIKASRMTVGDWAIMAGTIFGTSATWPAMGVPYGNSTQSDDAVLIEFPQQGVPTGKTVEVGRTSYGTGEFDHCVGQLFSLIFYPHHLTWTKSNTPPPGFYTPNPFHVEKFVVNGPKNGAAANTKIKLTVGDDMTIVDSLCSKPIGKSLIQPVNNPTGTFLGPGAVGYFDWWVCTSPALFCTGLDIDTLLFTGTSSLGSPTFVNEVGSDECDATIEIECAETDVDPPTFTDTIYNCDSASVTFADSRSTDRGLQSITWVPNGTTNPANFIITGPTPPIGNCYTDKAKHTVTIKKVPADSTSKGCFDFTATDCLGHQTYHSLCLSECIVTPHPDSLPPVFKLLVKSGTYDSTFTCDNGLGDNNRLDSFQVSDNNKHDSGICKLDTIPGSVDNYDYIAPTFKPGDPIVRFSFRVHDSMKIGNICIRATDCSKEVHYSDTCIHYCPLKDIIAPRISITKIKAGHWSVTVIDSLPWDRGIETITIINPINMVQTTVPQSNFGIGARIYTFQMDAVDTLHPSSFCIEASDTAGNHSVPNTACGNQTVSSDSLCPNIVITPDLNTNPTKITVNVNDIHFVDPPTDTIQYAWDTGIDSVWFTNNSGMNVPPTILGNGNDKVPAFQVSVANPDSIGTVVCVTINAVDKHGNVCSEVYCYPYTPDTLRPVIKLWYDPTNKANIFGVITDSTVADRGLDSIALFHNIPGLDTNLKWKNVQLAGVVKEYTIDASNAINRDPARSSTGAFWAIDRWGAFYGIPTSSAHTAKVDFAIWVQDFKMKQAIQPKQGTSFFLPVYFVKNDSFPVFRKNISDVTLGFTLKGDVNSIVFDSAGVAGTEMETQGWSKPQWNPYPSGSGGVINGSMGSGKVMDSKPLRLLPLLTENADSLVLLYFHALPNDSTRRVTITIDSLILNRGRDSLYTGTVSSEGISTALMPAPYGTINGGVIVITGACSPQLVTNIRPSSVSLDPPHPNPFTHSTTFEYTVAEDGPVRFGVYDMLGQEIKLIVNDFQKQGRYTVTFDGSTLGSGNYIARLTTGGEIRSRRIGVEK